MVMVMVVVVVVVVMILRLHPQYGLQRSRWLRNKNEDEGTDLGSVKLGSVNEGANLGCPAHCRRGKSDTSPTLASKFPTSGEEDVREGGKEVHWLAPLPSSLNGDLDGGRNCSLTAQQSRAQSKATTADTYTVALQEPRALSD